MTDRKYQNVILVTADGRRLVYTGKFQVSAEDTETMRIVNIGFGEPHELPAEYSWGTIGEESQ